MPRRRHRSVYRRRLHLDPGRCRWRRDHGDAPAGHLVAHRGPRGNVRDTTNFIAHSQTDLTAIFNTGAVEHHLVAGVSFSKEDFELDGGNGFRNADGSELPDNNASYPLQDLHDPYNIWTGPTNFVRTSHVEGSLNNQAVYLFDTLKFSERWLLNLGARYEHNEGATTNYTVSEHRSDHRDRRRQPVPQRGGPVLLPRRRGVQARRQRQRLSVVRQQQDAVQGIGQRRLQPSPTAMSIRKPRSTSSWAPSGTSLDDQLALTAALFRNERSNYRVNSADPELQPEQVLDGKARVDGIALGAAGRITRHGRCSPTTPSSTAKCCRAPRTAPRTHSQAAN